MKETDVFRLQHMLDVAREARALFITTSISIFCGIQ